MNREKINTIEMEIKSLLSNKKDTVATVAVYGLMNAGKSYLLNMITNNIENEFFKTNDIRETAENKSHITEKCIYIDTPGLDANESDTEEANKGIASADVILFVHQPIGELDKSEINFLSTIKNSFGECAEKNIILVISKIDKEPNLDKLQEIKEKILFQCKSILGFMPNCLLVSSTRFKNGKSKNNNKMIQSSNVDYLAQEIENAIKNAAMARTERKKQNIQRLLSSIQNIKKGLVKEIEENKQEIIESFKPFNLHFSSFEEFVKDSQKQYDNI